MCSSCKHTDCPWRGGPTGARAAIGPCTCRSVSGHLECHLPHPAPASRMRAHPHAAPAHELGATGRVASTAQTQSGSEARGRGQQEEASLLRWPFSTHCWKLKTPTLGKESMRNETPHPSCPSCIAPIFIFLITQPDVSPDHQAPLRGQRSDPSCSGEGCL